MEKFALYKVVSTHFMMSKWPCQDAQQNAVVPSEVQASILTLQLVTRYSTTFK